MPKGEHANHVRGSAHYRWNSGRMLSPEGYVKLRVGVDHPLADPNGYAYEHLVIWAAAGRPLPGDGELLHHRDEDRQNNRIDNLELITRGEHNALHLASGERRDPTSGQFQKVPA